jgi:hypothetical protein
VQGTPSRRCISYSKLSIARRSLMILAILVVGTIALQARHGMTESHSRIPKMFTSVQNCIPAHIRATEREYVSKTGLSYTQIENLSNYSCQLPAITAVIYGTRSADTIFMSAIAEQSSTLIVRPGWAIALIPLKNSPTLIPACKPSTLNFALAGQHYSYALHYRTAAAHHTAAKTYCPGTTLLSKRIPVRIAGPTPVEFLYSRITR